MLENPQFVPVTLAVLAVLNLLALLLLLRLSSRVSRLQRALAPPPEIAAEREERGGRDEAATAGAFEAFLAEDPARRELPKKDQFAAFRRWRAEKGLNWRAPADPG
jgi:hypothetical protein